MYLSNFDKSLFINVGIINKEKSIPTANGKRTDKLRSASDPIIKG